MLSETLKGHFARLEAQRLPIRRAAIALSAETLWACPEPGRWSIGENLQHLTKMVRLFRRFSSIALVLERPLARARQSRPFPTRTHDLFSGRVRRAPLPVRPNRPADTRSATAELQDLEKETEAFKDLVRGEEESILGHVWLWDPVMGSQNLLQVVDLLAVHEEHHFGILRRRWPEIFLVSPGSPYPPA